MRLAHRAAGIALSIGSGRLCPLCGWSGRRFQTQPNPWQKRRDAVCPRCGSTERQRLARLLVDVGRPVCALHVAPEAGVESWLRNVSANYLSIDLYAPAMQVADVAALPFENETFDLIWCSHVLEHVIDDRQAMAELFRVLQPGGMAVIQVPIWREETTFEDPAITTPQERLAFFHQADHVRLYGFDIVDRLSDVGFLVEVRTVRRLPAEMIVRHSLNHLPTNEVFLCRR